MFRTILRLRRGTLCGTRKLDVCTNCSQGRTFCLRWRSHSFAFGTGTGRPRTLRILIVNVANVVKIIVYIVDEYLLGFTYFVSDFEGAELDKGVVCICPVTFMIVSSVIMMRNIYKQC